MQAWPLATQYELAGEQASVMQMHAKERNNKQRRKQLAGVWTNLRTDTPHHRGGCDSQPDAQVGLLSCPLAHTATATQAQRT